MMKKIIITIIIIISFCLPAKAQLQGVGTFRIANATTAFGYSIPRGSTVYNISDSTWYDIINNINGDKSLNQLIFGTDYILHLSVVGGVIIGILNSNSIIPFSNNSFNLGSSAFYWANIYSNNLQIYGAITTPNGTSANWNTAYGWGNPAGVYLPFSGGIMTGTINSTSIIPTVNNTYYLGTSTNYFLETNTYNLNVYGTEWITGNSNIQGAAIASNFISIAPIGTQPYAATSTTLNTNLNADLLDGQHGSYYLDYNNLNNKPVTTTTTNEYIGIYNPNLYYFNGVFPNNATYYQASPSYHTFQHVILSDTTVHQGAITVSSDSLFINIAVDGDYEITYQFEFAPTLNESNMIFRLQTSSTNIFSIYEISVSANSHYQIIMNATIHLIAGDQIYLAYGTVNTTQNVFFQRMRIFVKKIN